MGYLKACGSIVGADKGEPGGEVGPGLQGFADGMRLFEQWDGLESKEIGLAFRENCDSFLVKLDEIIEGTDVIAVIFAPVVECGAVRAERRGNEDGSFGKFSAGGAGQIGLRPPSDHP